MKSLGFVLLALALLGGCAADATGGTGKPVEQPATCGKPGVICSYLGNGEAGLGEDGVPPLEVSLYLPQDLTFGPDGLPYVVDWNNHRIRTIVKGKVQTVIGIGEVGDVMDGPALRASLNHPTHVSFDDQGRLILSAWHNSKVLRYDPSSKLLSTLCGTGKRDYGGDDGVAAKAVLDLPTATAFDGEGRMLIMDQGNQRIRRVDQNDVITTVVGPNKRFEPVPEGMQQVCTPDAMGGGETCKLCLPAEASDPTCTARKPQGFAGDGGPADQALMYQRYGQAAEPEGRMEMGSDGTLYFCDTGNNRVRAVSPDGIISTVAGSGPDHYDTTFKGGYAGDGGPATQALLKNPIDVAVGSKGALYIADTQNSCIRKVDANGMISTLAGKCGKRGFAGDGGHANAALLDRPYGVALDTHGNLYIADTHNQRIRVVYGVE
jgi:sugar lactone lactonase YvrE